MSVISSPAAVGGPMTRPLLARLREALGHFAERLALADAVAHERRTLAGLDDRLLRDIGVDRATAVEESRRDYWDLPARRRA